MAQNWTTAILQTIEELGGKATLQQVYENIGRFKDLTDTQLTETKWGGLPAYQHVIRSASSHLHKTGKLNSRGRGTYELTEDGRRNLRSPDELSDDIPTLRAEEAQPESGDEAFDPDDTDRRNLVERQIRERRGQQRFRDDLRTRYDDRCLATGCTVLAVLEAAHISPYRGDADNHPENGLLLRSDIHTLFDLNLLGIDPALLQIKVHPDVVQEYTFLDGRVINWPTEDRPSQAALILRYESFNQRLRQRA